MSSGPASDAAPDGAKATSKKAPTPYPKGFMIAMAKVRTWLDAQPRVKGFGNGRLARNLFEDAVGRQAGRIVALASPTDDELVTLTADDIPDVGEGPGHGD